MTKADIGIEAVAYLKQPYSRVLIPDEDGGYSAEVLEFPGCFSQGDTAEEAFSNLEEAAKNWIEATLEAGRPIPPATSDYDYAGKVALRLPRSYHRQAVRMAERDGVSLNQWLVSAVAARLGAEELYDRIAERAENSWLSKTLTADNRLSKVIALIKGWTQISTGGDLESQTIPARFVFEQSTSETLEVEG